MKNHLLTTFERQDEPMNNIESELQRIANTEDFASKVKKQLEKNINNQEVKIEVTSEIEFSVEENLATYKNHQLEQNEFGETVLKDIETNKDGSTTFKVQADVDYEHDITFLFNESSSTSATQQSYSTEILVKLNSDLAIENIQILDPIEAIEYGDVSPN